MSKSEAVIQQEIRLAAAYQGLLMFRNNSGAFQDANGRWVRYGISNDSKALNEKIKGSDLIGLTPTLVTPDMVGTIVGVFTAIEDKPEDWRFRPSDKRAVAQLAFMDLVRQAGGYAGFAQSPEDMMRIIGRAPL
jgi:hypothetical protein